MLAGPEKVEVCPVMLRLPQPCNIDPVL